MPRWARRAVLRSASAGARVFGRLHALANELPVVLLDPDIERQAIEDHYGDRYREPAYQTRGLWPFEQRALHRYFPAPPARILVPGAGTGREVLALLAAGYAVDAFEPAAPMVELASRTLAERGAGPVACMSLQEWSRQPAGRYDGVLTGWGMWTHILRHDDRIAALRAFRSVCAGPVLLSFDRRERYADHTEQPIEGQPLHPPSTDRLGHLTREVVRRRLLRRSPIERGTGFRNGVFVHWVDEPELREEAAAAGYQVAFYERDGARYPHGVLVPREPTS